MIDIDELTMYLKKKLDQKHPLIEILKQIHKQFDIPYKIIAVPEGNNNFKYPLHTIIPQYPEYEYTKVTSNILNEHFQTIDIELKDMIFQLKCTPQLPTVTPAEYDFNFHKYIMSQTGVLLTSLESLKHISIKFENIDKSVIVITPVQSQIKIDRNVFLYNIGIRFKLGLALSENLRIRVQQYCKHCNHVLTCMLKPDQSNCNLYLLTKEFKDDKIKK